MDHHSAQRPALPGSTPASKINPYQAKLRPPAPPLGSALVTTEPPSPHSRDASLERLAMTLSIEGGDQESNNKLNDSLTRSINAIPNNGGMSILPSSQKKLVQKTISRLPYDVREEISSVMNFTLSLAESSKLGLEVAQKEVVHLRAELKKKASEFELAHKTCEVYRQRLAALEEKMEGMKDTIDTKEKFAIRNRKAMSMLSQTNRMLSDALESLQATAPDGGGGGAGGGGAAALLMHNHHHHPMDTPMDLNAAAAATAAMHGLDTHGGMKTPIAMPGTPGSHLQGGLHPPPDHMHPELDIHNRAASANSALLLPMSVNVSNLFPHNNPDFGMMLPGAAGGGDHHFQHNSHEGGGHHYNHTGEGGKVPTASQTDKLRESLLRVAREHYRSVKNTETLERQVEELRLKLKESEKLNKKLEIELEDLRSVTGGGGDSKNGMEDNSNKFNENDGAVTIPIGNKNGYYGKIDERFKSLLSRQTIDPTDALVQLRRLLAYMAAAPSSLNLSDVTPYLLAPELMKILDVEMVCLFLLEKNYLNEAIVKKYTPRSKDSVAFKLHAKESQSLASDILKMPRVVRHNRLDRIQQYRVTIDGVPGVMPRRILSIPLLDVHDNSRVLGTVHLINRNNNVIFSEGDELFAMIYADFAAMLIHGCNVTRMVTEKFALFETLVDVPSRVSSLLPDLDSLSSLKSLTLGDIVSLVEEMAHKTLKCSKARLFLDSSRCGEENGSFICREEAFGKHGDDNGGGGGGGFSSQKVTSTRKVPLGGIAGHVFESHIVWDICEDTTVEGSKIHPVVDLEPLPGQAMVSLVVKAWNGESMGVLQVLQGPSSAKLRPYHSQYVESDTGPPAKKGLQSQQQQQQQQQASKRGEREEDEGKGAIFFPQAAAMFVRQLSAPLEFLLLEVTGHSNSSMGKRSRALKGAGGSQSELSKAVSSAMKFSADPMLYQRQLSETSWTRRASTASINSDDGIPIPMTPLDTPKGDRKAVGIGSFEGLKEKEKEKEKELEREKEEAAATKKSLEQAIKEIETLKTAMEAANKASKDGQVNVEQWRNKFEEASSEQKRLEREVASLKEGEESLVSKMEKLIAATSGEGSGSNSSSVAEASHAAATAAAVEAARTALQSQFDEELNAFKTTHKAKVDDLTEQIKKLQLSLSEKDIALQKSLESKAAGADAAGGGSKRGTPTKDNVVADSGTITTLTVQLESVQQEKDDLVNQVIELNAALSSKDGIIKILQDQLVKMAGDNLAALGSNNNNNPDTKSKTKTSSSPSAASTGTLPPRGPPSSRPPSGNLSRTASKQGIVSGMSATGGGMTSQPVMYGDWQECYDEQGNVYYYNVVNEETSWTLPGAADGTAGGGAAGNNDWVELKDESGAVYYWKESTGETSWIKPSY